MVLFFIIGYHNNIMVTKSKKATYVKHNIVILDKKAPNEVKEYFIKAGVKIVETVVIDSLYPAISSHPDIQICKVVGDIFVAAPEVYDYYKNALPDCQVLKGESALSGTYPYDIAYNIAIKGKIAFHKATYTDPVVARICKANAISILDVKQGYSKCNIAFAGDGIITSDASIYRVALDNKIDALLIENDPSILLDNFPYGFIGGAGGTLDENSWGICGDIRRHKNFEQIIKFCNNHKTSIKCLYDGHILDIGSILYF